MQNQKYVVTGGDRNNRTVAEAKLAGRLLAALGIPSLGIVAIAPGNQEIVELADFDTVGIKPELPANLEIRTSFGNGPDRNAAGEETENSIADHGSFMSVDKILDWRSAARHPDLAAAELLASWKAGINPVEIHARLMNLPGVAKAYGDAVAAALAKV